ncbi:MAG: MGMT family protein [Gammaproteobacteria bacterium]|nr:MGMT family protein [Gammaproteobacteria bacterium]
MPSRKLTRFRENVLHRVKEIPRGKVATYGDVGGAIAHVGEHFDPDLPWHRVVKQDGWLSDRAMRGQRCRLKAEGVRFHPDGRVDLELFGWKEKPWGPIE